VSIAPRIAIAAGYRIATRNRRSFGRIPCCSYLTVRNLPADVAAELERERKRRGTSLNQAVLNALRKGLGLGTERKSNGLAALAGKWTAQELEEFDSAVGEAAERVDEELWR
jgi:plasmid stability protein